MTRSKASLAILVLAASCARARGEVVQPPSPPGVAATHAHDAGEAGHAPARAPAQTGSQAESHAGAPEPALAPPRPALDAAGVDALLALPASGSTSLGGPNDGRIEGALAFPFAGPGFRFGPRRDPESRYGTVEHVQALLLAVRHVEATRTGSELTVHDLSRPEGGPIPHHGSHRAGRDVDVLFYLLDDAGQPRSGLGVPIEPDGTGTDYGDLLDPSDDALVRIDVPRTWAFVEGLLLQDRAAVQRIFVVEHVRTMLLEHATRSGAQPRVLERFVDLTCQPSYPHDDHLHIRFFCSSEDIRRGCTDSAPIYPWHRTAMRALGTPPVAQVVRPDRPPSEVTTEAEARAAAPAMHPSVEAFLARREAWRDQPHPGRRYCR